MSSRFGFISSAIQLAGGVIRLFSPVDLSVGALTSSLDRVGAALDAAESAAAIADGLGTTLAAAVWRTSKQLGDELPEHYRDISELATARLQDAIDALGPTQCLALALFGEDEFVAAVRAACEPALRRDLSDRELAAVEELIRASHTAILSLATSAELVGPAMVAGFHHLQTQTKHLENRLGVIESEVAALRDQRVTGCAESTLVSGGRPARAVGFVERSMQARLWTQILENSAVTIRSLAGMRGIGKSQLASALAARCIDEGWSAVVWVDATGRDAIVQQLSEIAMILRVATSKDDAEAASRLLLTWFASQPPSDRLVVFDNVASLDDLRGLIPSGRGVRVVVTTTIVSDAIGEPVDVGLFTRDESIGYLDARTRVADAIGADRVAAMLGDLPVAIAQAASTMRLLDIDYVSYIDRLDSHPLRGAFVRAPGDAYPVAVDVALLASVDAMVSTFDDPDAVTTARLMLGALATLDEVGVARQWLVSASGDQFIGRAVLGRLVENSIVGLSDDGSRVSVHRLVARVLREAPSTVTWIREGASFALDVVRHALAVAPIDFVDRRTHLFDVAAQFKSVILCADDVPAPFTSDALRLFAEIVTTADDCHAPYAGTSLAPAFTRLATVDEADAGLIATAGTCLAGAFRSVGEHQHAVELQTASLAAFEELEGPDHVLTLAARNNLAHALLAARRALEAVPMLLALLPECERLLGPKHRVTFACRKNLADGYLRLGDTERSVLSFETLLTDLEEARDPGSDDMFDVRYALACAYEAAEDIPKATAAFAEALTRFEGALGPDHHRTTDTRRGLSRMHVAAGQAELAIPLAQRAMDDEVRVSGMDHHSTIDARGELAAAYEAAGEYEKAIDELSRTLDDHLRVVGANHPDTFVYRNRLALARAHQGGFADAISLLSQNVEELHELAATSPGPYGEIAITARTNLAHTCEKAGRLLTAGFLYAATARAHEIRNGIGSDDATAHWIASARIARRLGSPRGAHHMYDHAVAALLPTTYRSIGQRANLVRMIAAVSQPERVCLLHLEAVPPATVWRSRDRSASSGPWLQVQDDPTGVSIAPPKRRSRDR